MSKYQYCIKINKAIDALATPLLNYQYQINKCTHAQRMRKTNTAAIDYLEVHFLILFINIINQNGNDFFFCCFWQLVK